MSEDKKKVIEEEVEEIVVEENLTEEKLDEVTGGWNPVVEKPDRKYPIVPDAYFGNN